MMCNAILSTHYIINCDDKPFQGKAEDIVNLPGSLFTER